MIELPDFKNSFHYENMFYHSCDATRIEKILTQHHIFKLSVPIEGVIIECGVFKGSSLLRYSMFREIHNITNKQLIGFDSFGAFPETNHLEDMELRKEFIELDGEEGISKEQLELVLNNKNRTNFNLVKGDICQTVPLFVNDNPDLAISFINLDVDIYEPSSVVLEYLYPKLSYGGVLLLDNYNEFPGETKAANDYCRDNGISIKKFGINKKLHYIIK